MDTTLTDFTDMKCQRGDLSFIFNGNAVPSESFVVLDNEQRVYQRIHHEVREAAQARLPKETPPTARRLHYSTMEPASEPFAQQSAGSLPPWGH